MARNTEIVLVRFIVANAPYMSGETAGFPPETAKRFVDRKRAVYVEPAGDQNDSADEAKAKSGEAATSPAEIVPKKLSGPWYMVGDEKIKGKATAEARAAELNKA
jgi:hypothetical protein